MASAKPQTERIMPLATVDATKPTRLDAKILEHLSDRVILKPLIRWNEAYREFPRYVMEYLCARYVDPNDPVPGQTRIDRMLAEHYTDSSEAQVIRSRLRDRRTYTLLGDLRVRLDEGKDIHWA